MSGSIHREGGCSCPPEYRGHEYGGSDVKIWRSVLSLSAIGLAFTLLVACSSSGEPSESGYAVDSQSEAIQDTAGDVQAPPEQASDVSDSEIAPESQKDGMVMVYVPEGKFEMGSSDEQRDLYVEEGLWRDTWNPNEQPVHTVYLDAFWIDQTEVTNGQYALCVATGVCLEPHSAKSATRTNYYGNPEFEDYPIVYADWHMAEAYCTWAGRRLPTEAEWEKAARGTDGRTYPWGEGIDTTLANYGGDSVGNSDTVAVGSYVDGASPYGALDMAGNVREWVADEFDRRYYHDSPSENPAGPTLTGSRFVVRGGSWQATANSARSACRYPLRADHRDFPSNGFRCATSP